MQWSAYEQTEEYEDNPYQDGDELNDFWTPYEQ